MSNQTSVQDLIDQQRSSVSIEYMNLIAWTLYMSDYFQTLEAEVTLVWGREWALGKVLFLLLRYYSHLDNIFGASSEAFYWAARSDWDKAEFGLTVANNVSALVLPYTQIGILMLCIYGLFGPTRAWRNVCIVAYVTMLSISSTLMINHLVQQAKGSTLEDDSTLFRIIGNYWVFARSLALLLLGATALYKHYGGFNIGVDQRVPSLTSVLRRDGSLCYLGILGTTLWACIVYTPGFPKHLKPVAYSATISRAVTSIFACRLIMNLRKNASGQGTQAGHEMASAALRFANNHMALRERRRDNL